MRYWRSEVLTLDIPNEQLKINFSKDEAYREFARFYLPVFRSLLEESGRFIDKIMELSSEAEDENETPRPYAFFNRRIREALPEMAKNFNETIGLLEKEAKDFKLKFPQVRRVREKIKFNGNYFDILLGIKSGCRTFIDFLEHETKQVDFETLTHLEALKKDVRSINLLDSMVTAYMYEAIKAAEQDMKAAPVLLAGKVVINLIEKMERSMEAKISVKIKDKSNDSNHTENPKTKDEKLARMMINENFIRRDQEELYITVFRKARNYYSHDLDFPKSLSESIGYIGTCISLLKIYPEFLSKLNSPNEGE